MKKPIQCILPLPTEDFSYKNKLVYKNLFKIKRSDF